MTRKALLLFKEMKEDFLKYDKDLKKVSVVQNEKEKRLGRFEFGKSGRLFYVFGKFHPTDNNIFTGNKRAGNRIVKIVFSNTVIDFKTTGTNTAYARVEEERVINNPDYDGNTIRKRHNTIEDSYYISTDIVKKIVNYFLDEYNKQYPEIGKYKNSISISELERGIKPSLKHFSGKDKNGLEVFDALYKGENEQQLIRMMSLMTKNEYELARKKMRVKDSLPSDLKEKEWKNRIKEKILHTLNPLLDKYNIKADRIDIIIYRHEIKLTFIINKTTDEVSNSFNKLVTEFPPIENENGHLYVHGSHRLKDLSLNNALDEKICFATIIFESTEFKES